MAEAALLRANANYALKNYPASLHDINTVIHIQPPRAAWYEALIWRAWIRVNCPDPSVRDFRGGIADAKQACKLTKWKNVSTMNTLAQAYAASGDYDSAIRAEEQAIGVANSASKFPGLQKNLVIVKQHRPVVAASTLPPRQNPEIAKKQ